MAILGFHGVGKKIGFTLKVGNCPSNILGMYTKRIGDSSDKKCGSASHPNMGFDVKAIVGTSPSQHGDFAKNDRSAT